jgi:hypothetical protein
MNERVLDFETFNEAVAPLAYATRLLHALTRLIYDLEQGDDVDPLTGVLFAAAMEKIDAANEMLEPTKAKAAA